MGGRTLAKHVFKPPKKAILDPLMKEVSRNIENTIKKVLPETGNTKFAGPLPPSTLFLKDLITHITCFQNPVISLDEKQRLREAIDSARVKRS